VYTCVRAYVHMYIHIIALEYVSVKFDLLKQIDLNKSITQLYILRYGAFEQKNMFVLTYK